jgi:hypothetical protein
VADPEKQNESDIATAQLAVNSAYGCAKLSGNNRHASCRRGRPGPERSIEMATLLGLLDPNELGGEASQMLKKYQNDILLPQVARKRTDVLTGTQSHDANYYSDLD